MISKLFGTFHRDKLSFVICSLHEVGQKGIVSPGESTYCLGGVEQMTYVSSDHLATVIHLMLTFFLWFKRLALLMLGEQLCQTPTRLRYPCSTCEIKHLLSTSQSPEASLLLTPQRRSGEEEIVTLTFLILLHPIVL